MLRGAKIQAEWIDPPTAEAIRHNDRKRLLEAMLAPAEFDDEDRELAARLMAERSAEDIAAALVRAHRAAMPQAEELIENTPRRARRPAGAPPRGFEDVVWFRMDIGRRQNADPRWILPLLCRRGHITRNEIGAIRIGPTRPISRSRARSPTSSPGRWRGRRDRGRRRRADRAFARAAARRRAAASQRPVRAAAQGLAGRPPRGARAATTPSRGSSAPTGAEEGLAEEAAPQGAQAQLAGLDRSRLRRRELLRSLSSATCHRCEPDLPPRGLAL
jgi:ATP-dependent RNA helicase DeaD